MHMHGRNHAWEETSTGVVVSAFCNSKVLRLWPRPRLQAPFANLINGQRHPVKIYCGKNAVARQAKQDRTIADKLEFGSWTLTPLKNNNKKKTNLLEGVCLYTLLFPLQLALLAPLSRLTAPRLFPFTVSAADGLLREKARLATYSFLRAAFIAGLSAGALLVNTV